VVVIEPLLFRLRRRLLEIHVLLQALQIVTFRPLVIGLIERVTMEVVLIKGVTMMKVVLVEGVTMKVVLIEGVTIAFQGIEPEEAAANFLNGLSFSRSKSGATVNEIKTVEISSIKYCTLRKPMVRLWIMSSKLLEK
jgi:hypothetical protein